MEQLLREKLHTMEQEFNRLSDAMCSQKVASNPDIYREYRKKQSALEDLVMCWREFKRHQHERDGADDLLRSESDAELRELAEAERRMHAERLLDLEAELKVLLLPKDPNDAKNTIIEIRAGTGGDEAGLFAADLFRAYSRFAETKGWKIEILSSNETGIGGLKEITFKVTGDNVYSHMKFEGGTHRVQRVPATEAQGRIHTSAVTVAVLPEADEVEIQIAEHELIIDVYRSSGPGGQSVNTTDSAVRVTHKPTGLVVTCQDEKSQHKNKARAILILRARLLAKKQDEEDAKRSADRRSQVGSGDRSERIRTYNFPQNRVTDHRIGLSLHRLGGVMEGDFEELIDGLIAADRAARLAST